MSLKSPTSPTVSVNRTETFSKEEIRDSERFAEDQKPSSSAHDEFPDGGLRAWLVVLGTTCGTCATFGYINSFGVFQAYYEETLLSHVSPSQISWIGSVQYAFCFMPGLITGRLFDLGYLKIPFLLSSTLLVVATFLVAECKEFWQFLLCQGMAIGLACGCIFGPVMGIVGHWFKKRRGLALGYTAVGSSIGGTVLPIAARKLIPLVGFPWTMRILGFILMAIIAVPNITLARRLPPRHIPGGLFPVSAFKQIPFTLWSIAAFAAFLGLYTVLVYIDISAISYGISPDISFYLVSIGNASSLLGRLVTGFVVDKTGAINFIAPMTLGAAVMTYSWPYAHSLGTLVVIAVIYGFFSGAFVSSFLMPVYELGDLADIGRRTGMVMAVAGVGALVGPPISGSINHSSGGFEMVGVYAGTIIIVSVIFMLLTRHLVLRKLWGKF